MNDNRFIELVNLYIDREITAAETEELEVQIQTDPRRRAIYNQYCKINRATSLVYDSFRAQATEATLPLTGEGSITRFEDVQRKRRAPSVIRYCVGGLAAAACVAFAFMQYNSANRAGEIELSVAQVAPSAMEQAPAVAAAPMRAEIARPEPTEANERNYAALIAALRSEERGGFADTRLKAAMHQPESLFSDGVFDVKGLPASINSGLFRTQSQSVTPQTEFAAFQFQR